MLLGSYFLDKHVEAIRPRKSIVEVDRGVTVPLVLKPSTRAQDAQSLPEDHEFTAPKKRVNKNVQVVDCTVLPAQSQTWVTVKPKRAGLILVKPTRQPYENHMCLDATGVAQVQSDEPFRILLANFGINRKLYSRINRL